MTTKAEVGQWAKEYDRAMLAVAGRYAGPSTTDEDIRQDVLLAVLQKLDEVGQVSSPKALLLKYVTNVGRNQRRKRDRRNAIYRMGLLQHVLAADEPPPRDPRTADLLRAIKHLPVQQRRTLHHMLVDQMSDVEIAKSLGVTTATVRSNRFRAVQALKQVLRG